MLFGSSALIEMIFIEGILVKDVGLKVFQFSHLKSNATLTAKMCSVKSLNLGKW